MPRGWGCAETKQFPRPRATKRNLLRANQPQSNGSELGEEEGWRAGLGTFSGGAEPQRSGRSWSRGEKPGEALAGTWMGDRKPGRPQDFHLHSCPRSFLEGAPRCPWRERRGRPSSPKAWPEQLHLIKPSCGSQRSQPFPALLMRQGTGASPRISALHSFKGAGQSPDLSYGSS